MRIAFFGAQGVGKSTAAKHLAGELGLPLISGTVRTTAARLGVDLRNVHPTQALEFQWAALRAQIAAEDRNQAHGFVSDRAVVDFLAYWEAHARRFPVPFEETLRYQAEALPRLQRYDLLILVPPMFDLMPDGTRPDDPSYQREIHEILSKIAERWRMFCPDIADKVYTVTTEGQERVAELRQLLEARR